MLAGRQKIVKANGAQPDELEAQVAQELLNLEVSFDHSVMRFYFILINCHCFGCSL
jgi:hypothetical protein